MHHIEFIHSFIRGYLGWFHLLALVNNAAVNMRVQISLRDLLSVLVCIYPEAKLLDHMVILRLTF